MFKKVGAFYLLGLTSSVVGFGFFAQIFGLPTQGLSFWAGIIWSIFFALVAALSKVKGGELIKGWIAVVVTVLTFLVFPNILVMGNFCQQLFSILLMIVVVFVSGLVFDPWPEMKSFFA